MASFEYLPVSDVARFHEHVATLTPSQKALVALLNDWCRRRRFLFALVTGGPGSGKTHGVVETLRFLNLKVVKMSFTARLALKIGGQTVHRTMFSGRGAYAELKRVWDALEFETDVDECLKMSRLLSKYMSCEPVDLVVLDEVGMLPFWFTYRICEHFRQQPSKGVAVVGMGDKGQLKPVKSELSVFHVDFERFFPSSQKIEMTESKRFTPDYERVINRLRELMAREKAVDDADHPLLGYVCETFPVADCITQEMMKRARFVLAFKNETVNGCNDFYLDQIVGDEEEYLFPDGTRLRKNCKAMVTQNNCGEGVCNGSSVIFLDYDYLNDVALCRRTDTKELVRVRRSVFNCKVPLVPGFAVTIHKFQGETIDDDKIVMSFDGSQDLNLIYTALSRVRDVSQIMAVVL